MPSADLTGGSAIYMARLKGTIDRGSASFVWTSFWSTVVWLTVPKDVSSCSTATLLDQLITCVSSSCSAPGRDTTTGNPWPWSPCSYRCCCTYFQDDTGGHSWQPEYSAKCLCSMSASHLWATTKTKLNSPSNDKMLYRTCIHWTCKRSRILSYRNRLPMAGKSKLAALCIWASSALDSSLNTTM